MFRVSSGRRREPVSLPIVPARVPVFAAVVVGLLCLLGLSLAFGPLDTWKDYPLYYTGDGLWNLFVAKTIFETGWYFQNPWLGAPFGATFLDFPKPEVLYLAFFRVAGAFTKDPAQACNVFYFLGFPAVGWAALWTLRTGFRLEWPLAIAGAALYAFLPYHLLRIGHLFLANYFVVPLAIWLMLRIAADAPPFFERSKLGGSTPLVWLLCVLIAGTSSYYAYFSVLLLMLSGGVEAILQRHWRPLASAGCLVLMIAAFSAINLAPSLWYRIHEGPNLEVATRAPSGADVYSLRPIQMILPSPRHRVQALAQPARKYNSTAPLVNENWTSTLGMLASAGFVILLLALLIGSDFFRNMPVLAAATRINAFALFTGITGGLGTVIAVLLAPQYRAINRISVFIAFVSLAALLVLIQRWGERSAWKPRAFSLIAVALLPFGYWDQVPADIRPQTEQLVRDYNNDRRFVSGLESILPRNASVYQLPYVPFPEHPPQHRASTYNHLRPYLHATQLRWSLGEMKGRPRDLWHRALAELPVKEQLAHIRTAGFDGILVDRSALPDDGEALERQLREAGLAPQLESEGKDFAFYRLLQSADGTIRLPALPPVPYTGFYGWEMQGNDRWVWSRGNAIFLLQYHGGQPRHFRFEGELTTVSERGVTFQANGRDLAEVSLHPGAWRSVSVRVTLPPGRTELVITTDRPAIQAGKNDPREVAFALRNPRLVVDESRP